MRWISIAPVLGAALLPASARPLCRPDRSTTTGLPYTTATTSVETLSTDSVTATEASAIETTATFETTITESETATATTGFITVTSAATSEATTAEATTTEATINTSKAPEATNYVQNGDFEDSPNTDWSSGTSYIKDDPERASSGNKYVQYDVNDSEAVVGNQLSQTVKNLDTERLYRLTTYATVFNSPVPVKDSSTICVVQALQESSVLSQWRLDFTDLGTYKPLFVDFTPVNEDVTITMRLRCSAGKKVTFSVGLDDVSLHDIGPKLVG